MIPKQEYYQQLPGEKTQVAVDLQNFFSKIYLIVSEKLVAIISFKQMPRR